MFRTQEVNHGRYDHIQTCDEAGPMFGLTIDGYAAEDWPSSETEVFWGARPPVEAEVARVGVRSGFVTGETRFVTLRPTYGCLESTDSIPEREPGSLGREGRPLVLDGCSDQGDSTDADAGI
jgi:hypothetical protein